MSITTISDTRLAELLQAEQTLKALEDSGSLKGVVVATTFEEAVERAVQKRTYRVYFEGIRDSYVDVIAINSPEARYKASEKWKREYAIPAIGFVEEI